MNRNGNGTITKNGYNLAIMLGLPDLEALPDAAEVSRLENAAQNWEGKMHDAAGKAFSELAIAYDKIGRKDDAKAALEKSEVCYNNAESSQAEKVGIVKDMYFSRS